MRISDHTSVFCLSRCLALLCAAFLFIGVRAQGQVSTKVAAISPDFAIANAPITISADLTEGETVERVYLVYRPFGESQYQRAEMDLVGNTATVTLPSRVTLPPRLEYYIVLQLRTGTLETYPLTESQDPFTTPPNRTLWLPVRAETEGDSQILFLNPEPSAVLAPDEAVISISLLRTDSTIVRKATQVFLDGADVTQFVIFSDDILSLAPENLGHPLTPGRHRVSVRLYDRSGNLASAATLNFTVQGAGMFTYTEPVAPGFRYAMNLNLESRHELVNTVGTWYNRGGLNFTGNTGDWRFRTNLYVTSEESGDLQPQNRYFVGVEHPLVYAGLGDAYPSFPNLILSGKRVRGADGGLRFGAFNVDVVYGQTMRAVDGKVTSSFPKDSLASRQAQDPSSVYGPIDSTTWGKFSYGTYAQNLWAVRPSFGSGETAQFGFTYMHAKDDAGSIRYGIRPAENAIVGADLVTRLDSRRIEFNAQAAFSAYNSDISSGTFTDEYIESVYKDNANDVKTARDILKNFITVNDNLRPLSLSKLSTLAYDLALSLNYFGNTLRVTYLSHGSDYISIGQTYLRKDIRGFNVNDRVRFAQNQVFLTVGLERLEDNLSDTKFATTTYSTVTGSISYYPVDRSIPNVTVGASHFDNSNGLSAQSPDTLTAYNAVSDMTTQVFFQSSYDFTLAARHTAMLNFSTSNKDDNSLFNADVKSTTIGLGLMSRYGFPLQTNLDVALNLNTLPTTVRGKSQDLDYTTITARGRYGIISDILIATAMVSPTFGDFKRTVFEIGGEYYVLPTMSFILQFSYFENKGATNDNFVSLRYRYDL